MDKIKSSLLIGLIATLTFLGGVSLEDDDLYYCESRGIITQCDKLSSTAKTCYREDGNKICYQGWVEVENDLIPDVVPSDEKSLQWSCSPEGCIPK